MKLLTEGSLSYHKDGMQISIQTSKMLLPAPLSFVNTVYSKTIICELHAIFKVLYFTFLPLSDMPLMFSSSKLFVNTFPIVILEISRS